jgi:hypothetical protein
MMLQPTIFAFAVLTIFLTSIGGPAVTIVSMGLAQLMSPAEMRGRIVGLLITVAFGIQPIASLCLCAGAVLILLTHRELLKWNVPS